ncbi:MAG: hypothetical protein ACOYK6_06730 [Chthoniobacterales bacterium]
MKITKPLFLKLFFVLFTSSLFTPFFVSAKDTPQQEEQKAPLTDQKLQAFSASVQDFLSLEDEPPTDGSIAFPLTSELVRDILNLLTLNEGFEDYFQLYTAKVGSYIDDRFKTENVYDLITGKVAYVKYKHHYVVRPGKKHQVVGYLKCLDKKSTGDKVTEVVTGKKYGSSKYYFHSDAGGTNKYLLINLQYGFLSKAEIDQSNLVYNADNNDDELYGIHYDLLHQGKRKQAEYVWIKEEAHDGTIDGGPTKRNIFSLALWVALDNKEEELPYNYSSINSDNNQWGDYSGSGYNDCSDPETSTVNESN